MKQKMSPRLEKQVLEKLIRKHNQLYWDENKPDISDQKYDELVEKLKKLDPTNELVVKITPVNGGDRKKVKHLHPMLSLDKVYTYDDLINWCEKIARSDLELFVIQPKYDGCSAEFFDGTLSTRGNGFIGEDITDKVPLIKMGEIKHYARGEIVFPKHLFKRFKDRILRRDGAEYKNERAAVGGLLNRDDRSIFENILEFKDFSTENYLDVCSLEELKDAGEKYINNLIEAVQLFDDPTDGLVFKILDSRYVKELGSSEHHSKSEMAFKFKNPSGKAKLLGVVWSVGKHNITPIGILDPVRISGVTIKRVNLHNMKFIHDMNIFIGDTLIVERAGDVIPHVVGVECGSITKQIAISKCPACGFPPYQGDFITCSNSECSGEHLSNLIDSVRRIGIEGIGEPTIKKMIEVLGVKDVADIIELSLEDILDLDGFAYSSAQKLRGEIERVKIGGVYDWQILSALNIKGIGDSLSKKIIEEHELLELHLLSQTDLEVMEGVGPTRAFEIYIGLRTKENLLRRLVKLLNRKKEKTKVDARKICFTGKFPEKKSVYYAMAEEKGFEIVEKVNKETELLVVADKSIMSSKQRAVKKYNIEVLSIDELLNRIR